MLKVHLAHRVNLLRKKIRPMKLELYFVGLNIFDLTIF